MPARENPMKGQGESSICTPPAIAASIRPSASARQAASSATREEEQAVSIVAAGPRRSNTLVSRFDRIDSAAPVMK